MKRLVPSFLLALPEAMPMKWLLLATAVSLAVLVGCGDRDRSDYEKAKAANTVVAYWRYLDAHPKGGHAAAAKAAIAELDHQEFCREARRAAKKGDWDRAWLMWKVARGPYGDCRDIEEIDEGIAVARNRLDHPLIVGKLGEWLHDGSVYFRARRMRRDSVVTGEKIEGMVVKGGVLDMRHVKSTSCETATYVFCGEFVNRGQEPISYNEVDCTLYQGKKWIGDSPQQVIEPQYATLKPGMSEEAFIHVPIANLPKGVPNTFQAWLATSPDHDGHQLIIVAGPFQVTYPAVK